MGETESAISDVRAAGIVVTIPPQIRFETVAAQIEALGIRRDPDCTDVSTGLAGEPSFASWSGTEGDDLEVDYHYDEHAAARWLEVRGGDAKKRAADIASMLGGTRKGTVEDLLVGLMTPPRRGADDRHVAADMLRWRSLREALATAGPANINLIVPMIRAGLRDPDWRVRMTAIVAVGRLRLTKLAEEAMAAEVPAPGVSGLGSEDHRVLLALRQAAHDRAAGLPPSTGPGDEMPADIAAKRRAYQRHLHALLAGEAAEASDKAALMVSTLLDVRQA
jgi:hypothetical protein